MPRTNRDSTAEFEKAIAEGAAASMADRYVLKLYVTGSTPRSSKAVRNIRELCEQYLPGRYDLEVIDIYQQPELASSADLVAAPTLVKRLPAPLRKVVGDLSNADKVLLGLDIRAATVSLPGKDAAPAKDVPAAATVATTAQAPNRKLGKAK